MSGLGYFGKIWSAIRTTSQGLGITTRQFVKSFPDNSFTLEYPDEKLPIDKVTHRGIHEFDVDRCISCDKCANACPVDCIYIESVGKGKKAVMTRYEIDYSKCLFCSLCVPPCPSECIQLGEKYSLPGHTRDDMIVPFHLGVFPIQELTDHAKKQIEEYEKEGLYDWKDAQRKEHGLPDLKGRRNRPGGK